MRRAVGGSGPGWAHPAVPSVTLSCNALSTERKQLSNLSFMDRLEFVEEANSVLFIALDYLLLSSARRLLLLTPGPFGHVDNEHLKSTDTLHYACTRQSGPVDGTFVTPAY